MKNLYIAVFAGALTACANQANTTVEQEAIQVGIDQLNQQQQTLLDQCGTANETLALQEQRFDQLEQQLAASKKEAPPQTEALTCPSTRKSYTLGKKLVVGEAEWIQVEGVDTSLNTRIDTGASTSSLNAQDIVKFERDGKTWVRFNIKHGDGQQDLIIERPVVRYAEIKQSSSDKAERRAVVSLLVKIGAVSEPTEFTLADRSHLSYPVLLGRNFLRDIAVVDISKKYSQGKPSGKE